MKKQSPRFSKLYDKTIKEGKLKHIKFLLKKGADINSQDRDGRTALWWAAFNGNVKLVEFLLANNASPHLSDRRKNTPLDIATELGLGGHREIGEVNHHATIVNLLRSFIRNKESPDDDINGLAQSMSQLGLHAKPIESKQENNSLALPPNKEEPQNAPSEQSRNKESPGDDIKGLAQSMSQLGLHAKPIESKQENNSLAVPPSKEEPQNAPSEQSWCLLC